MISFLTRGLLQSAGPFLTHKKFVSKKMVDAVVEQFKSVARISDVKRAQILSVTNAQGDGPPDVCVQVTWSTRNLSAMERILTTCDYLVRGDRVTSFPPVPFDTNIVLHQLSKSGRQTAYVAALEKGKEGQCIIIVERDGSMRSYDLKNADKHGKVYADPEFSCLEWSSDESKLLYVAEKKRPKPTSFLTPPKSDGDDTRGTEFEYVDEWGEQLEGKHQSVVCILDLKTGEIKCHGLPDELCPGQLVWGPKDEGIFGVAFVSTPYRLGLIYCPIRESKLFYMDLEGNYCEVSSGSYNIRTPSLSPDGSRIAFLRSTVGGPHAKSAQLCLVSWPEKQEKIVIDVVPRERKIEEGHKFTGMYGYAGMPRRCWLEDGRRLVVSSFKFDDIVSYVVNVDSGTITELPHLGSLGVMDVCCDWLLVDFSYICQPNQILLAKVPGEGQERNIDFKEVTERRQLDGVQNHYHSHWVFVNKEVAHPDPKFSDIPISVIYYGPTALDPGAPKRPLICWPHGGPHTVLANIYYASATFFVKLGYSIVFPNYRGSLGFGEDGVNALPGHCGTIDVSDVHQATLSCLKRFPDVLDPSQVFLMGGSHGGFLVTHLAGQYPEFYRAVSARNPVTDISAMANVTDIPDWTFVEIGHDFRQGDVPNAEILGKMYQMSPISHIETLKAPVLLLVGKNDRRVSPYNGIHLHKMLLARGVETKLHIYDDCHPLSKVDVEADSLIHSALWFEKYRNKQSPN